MRRAAALLLLVAAVGLAVTAHDVLAWRDVLRGDGVQLARTWLPGDPVRSVLAVDDELFALVGTLHDDELALLQPSLRRTVVDEDGSECSFGHARSSLSALMALA